MRRFRSAATILVAALSISACIPNTNDDGVRTRAPVAVGGARTGGRLVVATERLGSLDPADATDSASRLVASVLCDQLVALDPVTGALKPAIARSWTIADRGRKVFMRLRRGVRFHNGRELVAEDVAFTLSRLASEDLASEAASLMSPVFGYELIHGDADTDDERFRRRIAGVTVVDAHAIEITLSEPFADWIRALAHPATSPLPREEIDRDPASFAAKPVCTGPYRLTERFEAGRPVRLARFGGYQLGNAAWTRGGAGWVDAVEFRPFDSKAAGQQAFERGEVDVAQRGEGEAAARSGREVVVPAAHVEYVGFPTSIPPFDDPAVRRALSLALDRDAIARTVYRGARTPATSFVPAVLSGAHRVSPCPGAKTGADPAAARAALARSRIDLSRTSVKLYYNDEFRNRALVEAVASAWRGAFGMRVETIPLVWGRFLELGTRPAGFDGAFRFGWAPEFWSPDPMLVPLFHVNGIGRDNLSRFGSRDFNDAIRSARRAVLEADRLRDYRRAEDILCRQLPMVPVVTASRRILLSTRVLSATKGHPVSQSGGEFALRDLYMTR